MPESKRGVSLGNSHLSAYRRRRSPPVEEQLLRFFTDFYLQSSQQREPDQESIYRLFTVLVFPTGGHLCLQRSSLCLSAVLLSPCDEPPPLVSCIQRFWVCLGVVTTGPASFTHTLSCGCGLGFRSCRLVVYSVALMRAIVTSGKLWNTHTTQIIRANAKATR